MIDWLRQIDAELSRVRESQNPGRIRTAARRIAGIALFHLNEIEKAPVSADYLAAIRAFIQSPKIPDKVRNAATRLEARLSPDFTSPSADPIRDAMLIVEFVEKQAMEGGNAGAPAKKE
ncbi:MAG TPA: hypothetical protein VMM58_03300 [Bacteroidota bacterium]|nr:hypothetical protein [Bacteroidota bacterium]